MMQFTACRQHPLVLRSSFCASEWIYARSGVIGTPVIIWWVSTTQTTRTRCPLESVPEMSVAIVCLKIRSHGCPRAAVLLTCSSRRSGVMLHMLTYLFANAALRLGMFLLLESPTHSWECFAHLSVVDCFWHPLCVSLHPQALLLLRRPRRRDCTSGPPPHNSGEYIGAGEIAPQAPKLTSWRASTGEGGLHLRPPPHKVDDLVADAVCRFEESEAPGTAIDTDAVVCE